MSAPAPDFGRTASDYRTYRHGFPEAFFTRLKELGIGLEGQNILDLGTGTGTVARGLALAGATLIAVDPSAPLIEQAKEIDQASNISGITYLLATAEETKQPAHFFDVVIAGQCWHWFNAKQAIKEIKRIIKSDGKLVIAHYDWIPEKGTVAELSERLISKYNRNWTLGGGNGFYPQWVNQLALAGFQSIETYSFDNVAHYSHEAWRGRIRASAGISASLSKIEVEQFDQEHAAELKKLFPEEILRILHRCFIVVADASEHFTLNFSIAQKESEASITSCSNDVQS